MEKIEMWSQRMPQHYLDKAIDTTRKLVKIDSINPPGNEKHIAKYIGDRLVRLGFKVILDEFEKNRYNVIATLGNENEIGVVLNGHLDVVPVSGSWHFSEFEGEISDGRMYGRGTCDMKAGLASMMVASEYIAQMHFPLKKGLMLLFVGDEENKNKGIKDFLSRHKLKADAAIIGEPTNLDVCIGNRGYASFYIKSRGKAHHASQPLKGENAIYKMARILIGLEKYSLTEILNYNNNHLGNATLSVGTINGGTKINIVPDECICEVERRVLPGENANEILYQIKSVVKDLGEVYPRSYIGASLIDENHPLVLEALQAIKKTFNTSGKVSVFGAGTEACFFTDKGIPTIILGPGSIEQAHKIDEFVEIEEIKSACQVYYEMLKKYLSNGVG